MKKTTVMIAMLALSGIALLVSLGVEGRRAEAQIVAQIPLAGSAIPQWVDELPQLAVVDGRLGTSVELKMEEHSIFGGRSSQWLGHLVFSLAAGEVRLGVRLSFLDQGNEGVP